MQPPASPVEKPVGQQRADALTTAIADFVDRQRSEMYWSGIDLSTVVARRLHFRVGMDPLFAQHLPGTHVSGQTLTQHWQSSSSREVAAAAFGAPQTFPPQRRPPTHMLRMLRGQRPPFKTVQRAAVTALENAPDVLFLSTADRLRDYAQPVLDAMVQRGTRVSVMDGVPTSGPGGAFAALVAAEQTREPQTYDDHITFARSAARAADHVFRKRCPRVLVTVEGNNALGEAVHLVARHHGIASVCLQQGWSTFVHSGFRGMSFNAMAMWGEAFSDVLRPHNPKTRFVDLGHPQSLAASRPSATDVTFFFQKPTFLYPLTSYGRLIDVVEQAGRRFPEHVVVRPHPAAPPIASDVQRRWTDAGVSIRSAHSETLNDALKRTRVAVGAYSTVLWEAAAVGNRVVAVNDDIVDRFSPMLDGLAHVGVVQNAADAVACIAEQFDAHGHASEVEPAHNVAWLRRTGPDAVAAIADMICSFL